MPAMHLSDMLSPERVVLKLRAADKKNALRKLADLIEQDAALPEAAMRDALALCVDLQPFMPRGGVSLVHTLAPGLERPMAAVARLQPPLDLGAPDGCPTDLLVLLVSPTERPQEHLRALACIARRLRRLDVRRYVRSAASRDEMYVALVSEEWLVEQERIVSSE